MPPAHAALHAQVEARRRNMPNTHKQYRTGQIGQGAS